VVVVVVVVMVVSGGDGGVIVVVVIVVVVLVIQIMSVRMSCGSCCVVLCETVRTGSGLGPTRDRVVDCRQNRKECSRREARVRQRGEELELGLSWCYIVLCCVVSCRVVVGRERDSSLRVLVLVLLLTLLLWTCYLVFVTRCSQQIRM
jgi:hypothetical protein